MIEGYPDICPPEIKLVKKKGLTTGQMQTINDRLQKKAQDLIGTEMVFDLVDEAKVSQCIIPSSTYLIDVEFAKRRGKEKG